MIKKINLIFVAILFIAQQGMGQEWLVPEDQKTLKNPTEYNLSNVKKGKDLYLTNCKSCHGDAGKNNGLPLVPPPPDVTSDIMQANTEGELFYKITNGRGGMPQFGSTISEDDRWRLVNYIRNYNPANEPVLVEAPPQKAKLLASVNETEKKVEVFAEVEGNDGKFLVLANASVSISAKKAFGNLPIGEVLTNAEGRAEYAIPKDLIGDEQGLVNVVVSLGEGFVTDPVILDAAKVGQPKQVPKLIKKEVLWSTNENVQTWLLLSYLGAVGGAWLAIAYVVFQIFKIWRVGKQQE
ncbi:cytochrome c [Prolixibacteraceae bacterium Z1-6]|uniref:Cytochrome c n=1 Tax=Draconibacterium aestuarii TaxID=2998507 RepID=A0A9X3J5G6_9BACT|nr:cytochrome c [Prolixibacteraceae bacterium Z1-6]